jgi:two-component system, OmpR family, sensor histidine kinase ChvG
MPPSPRGRLGSRIALRIFAFNALLVFLPVAAFSVLGSYERGLVDSLENALAQQARITAAWLGSGSAVAGGKAPAAKAAARLDAAAAKRALAAIGDKRTARFRVVDAEGRLLADSSDAESRSAPGAAPAIAEAPSVEARSASAPPEEDTAVLAAEPFLYRLFSAPSRLWRRYLAPPAPPFSSADFYASAGPRLLGSEIQEALRGKYGAATRVSSGGQVSVTLYSAVPVYSGATVVGAVLVSQSTYRILRDLYAIRLDIAKVFLGSLAAAGALSILLALTIVIPLKRLGAAASDALGPSSRPGKRAPPGERARAGDGAVAAAFPESRRRDEIGDLHRSLRGLVLRLDERVRQTERFAADAAHEFRNPLAAIRSAAELAEQAADPADRSRFHRAIVEDAERLRAITDGLRRLSLAEGGADPSSRAPVDAAAAGEAACARARARRALEGGGPSIEFAAPGGGPGPVLAVDPAALDIILDNLVDNAVSFAASKVRLSVSADRRRAVFSVEDDGPGIPPEHLGRVFDRFFTWRPGTPRGSHTGLGLSLALALARSEQGEIEASNRPEGGARFVASLPLAGLRPTQE